jgi:hypothetical protein
LSGQISDCLERAADAERRAAATTDPALRHDYEHIARTWRQLAASYQFSETLERFLLDRDRAKKMLM